jgi:hypothetical protein
MFTALGLALLPSIRIRKYGKTIAALKKGSVVCCVSQLIAKTILRTAFSRLARLRILASTVAAQEKTPKMIDQYVLEPWS